MLSLIDSAVLTPVLIGASLFGLVLTASYFDAGWRRIPNVLSLGGALAGVVLHLIVSGLDGLIFALAGWLVGFIFLIPGYALGKTGAGDVKLLAAVGTFVGPSSALIAGVATMISGSIIALIKALLARGESPWQRYALMCRYLFATGQWSYIRPEKKEVMSGSFPYAFAITTGAIFGYWHSLTRDYFTPGLG